MQAEQWLYIKKDKDIRNEYNIQLDLDSIDYNKNENSVTFNIKKDEDKNVYIYTLKYLYKDKKLGVLESTKYVAWCSPENKKITKVFDNPEYKIPEKNTLSETLELLIKNKNNLTKLKSYINNNTNILENKLSKELKNIDDVTIRFWINGSGKIYEYDYMFGNYNEVLDKNIITKDNQKYNYVVYITNYPKNIDEKWKKYIHIDVKNFNISDESVRCSYGSSLLNSSFVQNAMIPNMPSIARTVYQAQMSKYPHKGYGIQDNKTFFDNLLKIVSSTNISDSQKKIAIHILALKNLNYDNEFNEKLRTINSLEAISGSLNKGVIGVVLTLKHN